MRYYLIDHIIDWKSGKYIKGIKNVSMSEDFLEFHFPGNPIMPGVLLLEAFSQLTGWLEAVSSDFTNWFLINKVRKCSFYGFALPGDQVEIEVRGGEEKEAGIKVFSGIGTVQGKKKISAEFEGEILPLSEIEDISGQKNLFMRLTRKTDF
jgi:3-hydroxyacyl-[acyl-carrier-protein] dehydratase